MTIEELRVHNPDLVEEIEADAARQERERQRSLDKMLVPEYPALVALVEKARSTGKKAEDIAIEANVLLREKIASGEHLFEVTEGCIGS